MIVHLASVLFDYTGGRADVEASGTTVGAVLDDLERRYPGLRFRVIDEQGKVRTHMRIYRGSQPVASLAERVERHEELHVLAALSGG